LWITALGSIAVVGYFPLMLPLMFDLGRCDIVLIGEDAAAKRRQRLLEDAGATRLRVFTPPQLPTETELGTARLVFITDRTAPYVGDLAMRARARGALVHIEDDAAHSDVHLPAVLRRGHLTIAISTGGASPALAVRLKQTLGEWFGPEWRGRIDEIAALRQQWRDAGADAQTLKQRTEDLIERRRWLPRLSSRSQQQTLARGGEHDITTKSGRA
jgi:precorrin-2 dehydrogenase / sirohydrochlorin ferrochelatase